MFTFVRLFIGALIMVVIVLLILYCKTDYDDCYTEMEAQGEAIFGLCCGKTGGTEATNFLSEDCLSCPHFDRHSVFVMKDGEKK